MSATHGVTATTSALPARGRGLVVAGAIVTIASLAVTVLAVAYFIAGMGASSEAMSMVFPFLLMFWLLLAIPSWMLGIGLLGAGRQQQRGPVRGHVAAWIVAMAALPVIVLLLILAIVASGSSPVFFDALLVSIPLMLIASLAAGAWLVWGKPARA
ncbi:MAG: hypothetical protein ACR2KE_04240 [Candidatus Nanopelagicales bacterium]